MPGSPSSRSAWFELTLHAAATPLYPPLLNPCHIEGDRSRVRQMKRIPALLIAGMLAVSGWAEEEKPEPYSTELVKKAEAGDAKAQYDLGVYYFNVNGEAAGNTKEFLKWWTKSAEHGNAQAQLILGALYLEGGCVAKDPKYAAMSLRLAAEQGNVRAQSLCGKCYYHGIGVNMDREEGVKWWTKAADQGDVEAQLIVGQLYIRKCREEQDAMRCRGFWRQAEKLFKNAAEQGNAEAQYRLAMLYHAPDCMYNVPYSKEGVEWLKKSAKLGYGPAQRELHYIKAYFNE